MSDLEKRVERIERALGKHAVDLTAIDREDELVAARVKADEEAEAAAAAAMVKAPHEKRDAADRKPPAKKS